MTEAKHTPGPWVPVEMMIGSRSFWVAISAEGRLPETEANARLIAAAPDMAAEAAFLLERLSDLENGWDDDKDAYRDFCGHVSPSAARLRAILGEASK